MLALKQLLGYQDIVIQCHDNPDADALACGYALYEYFAEAGKPVRFIYGGRWQIKKPNLLEMIRALHIPVEYAEQVEISSDGLLITVDCQYGAGNLKKFAAPHIAIIDHHQQEIFDVKMSDIRPYLGSCATLVWELLQQADFDVAGRPDVATALYYGLFTDTNSLAEIYHPLDKDMRDNLVYNRQVVRRLQNYNLTLGEIKIAGEALSADCHNAGHQVAIFQARPCDPNILGFISDLALQVNTVDVCIVYYESEDGVKFSLRSCIREVMANELAAFLAAGIGSGGGHAEKAGGYISKERLQEKQAQAGVAAYFSQRIEEYYGLYDIVYSGSYRLDLATMGLYRKKNVVVGMVQSAKLFPKGSPLLIRTLEGDVEILSDDDLYIMIGIQGEVYPIRREKFERSYNVLTEASFDITAEYMPTVRNRLTGETVQLMAYAQACTTSGSSFIYAQPLRKNTKVFTSWDYAHYMSGKCGDYLAARQDDISDIYVVREDIFHLTYERAEEPA